MYGNLEPDDEKVMEEMARKMFTSPNATIFPGPLVLWAWNEHAVEKAKAVLEIAAQIPDVLIIPMPDYRPKYPRVDPEEVINPNHPNLTIWGNKIEACISVSAALGNWSIITILIALCLAMLSHTQTHCAQPLHRSTAT